MLFPAYAWNTAYACITSIQLPIELQRHRLTFFFVNFRDFYHKRKKNGNEFFTWHSKYSLLIRMFILEISYITELYFYLHTFYILIQFNE